MKRLAILGSTGSIGTQALEVVAANPGLFEVEVLSAHGNAALLIEQAKKFKPNAVVVTNEAKYKEVKVEAKTYHNGRGGKGSVAGSQEILFVCKPKKKHFVSTNQQQELVNERL